MADMKGNYEKAINEIEQRNNNLYFDYVDLGGGPRSLKVDLSGFEFESSDYDEYHGEGLAKQVIDGLIRSKMIESHKNEESGSFAHLSSNDVIRVDDEFSQGVWKLLFTLIENNPKE